MQDDKQPANPLSTGTLVPDIIKDIPIASQDNGMKPVAEDDELDKIMHDVGKDVKQVGQLKPKHHWYHHEKKAKADPKFAAKPIDQVKAVPGAVRPAPPSPTGAPQPAAKASAKPAKVPKPAKTHSAPVGTIVFAVIITGALIAAAFMAYK